MRLVAVDIGGTHARFAIATVDNGAITLGEPVTLKTSEHVSLQTAWETFASQAGEPLPQAAAIAIAAPLAGPVVRMTNNSWVIDIATLGGQIGADKVTLVNDFEAVAHAVAQAPASDFEHIAGPDVPLPPSGTISVVGPGTGLGVAHFYRHAGSYHVQATEGGHLDFAPVDSVDDAILARLRAVHRRVSTERVNSGPGIVPIYQTLCAIEGRTPALEGDRAIWQAAMAGEDSMAAAALDRFCMTLGTVAGDFALGHGAGAVVLAGGLGLRLRAHLPHSAFAARFCFKGRYEALMAGLPVKLIIQKEPGLFGAVAAFLQQHGSSQ